MSALTYWLLVGASAVFLILFILWNTDSFGSAKPCISAAVCAAICFFCVMFTSFTYWDSPSRFQSLSNTYKELQETRNTDDMKWARKAVEYNQDINIHSNTSNPVIWFFSGRTNIDWNSLKTIE